MDRSAEQSDPDAVPEDGRTAQIRRDHQRSETDEGKTPVKALVTLRRASVRAHSPGRGSGETAKCNETEIAMAQDHLFGDSGGRGGAVGGIARER